MLPNPKGLSQHHLESAQSEIPTQLYNIVEVWWRGSDRLVDEALARSVEDEVCAAGLEVDHSGSSSQEEEQEDITTTEGYHC